MVILCQRLQPDAVAFQDDRLWLVHSFRESTKTGPGHPIRNRFVRTSRAFARVQLQPRTRSVLRSSARPGSSWWRGQGVCAAETRSKGPKGLQGRQGRQGQEKPRIGAILFVPDVPDVPAVPGVPFGFFWLAGSWEVQIPARSEPRIRPRPREDRQPPGSIRLLLPDSRSGFVLNGRGPRSSSAPLAVIRPALWCNPKPRETDGTGSPFIGPGFKPDRSAEASVGPPERIGE